MFQAFQDGDTEVINGVTYRRQNGRWVPAAQAAPSPAAPQPLFSVPENPLKVREQQLGIARDQLGMQKDEGDIADRPLVNRGRSIDIARGEQDVRFGPAKRIGELRQEFNALPEVKKYSALLTVTDRSMNAPDTPQGDLSIIYGHGTAMDPDSVVRGEEMDMAKATASLPEQWREWAGRVQRGERLPPAVRKGLIESIRNAGMSQNRAYSQQYRRYMDIAKGEGFDFGQVVGHHLGDAFRDSEKAYVDRVNGGQQRGGEVGAGEIGGFGLKPEGRQISDEQAAQVERIYREQGPQAAQAYLQKFGFELAPDSTNLKEFQGVVQRRDPRIRNMIDERMKNAGGDDAFGAGLADAFTLGSLDELTAAGSAFAGAMQGKGSFSDLYGVNVGANRGYNAELQQRHPYLYGGGQFVGGAAMPAFGARSALGLARVGAGYGGAYGFNSAEGGVGERFNRGVEGMAVGAGVGYGLGRAGEALRNRKQQDIPPLVDPVTGRLNEPLEAAGSANRVAAAKNFGIDLPMDAAGDRTAALIGKGFDVSPASAGVMNDARRITEGQVGNAVEDVASLFGRSRTLNEGGDALQSGAKQWIGRADDVSSKLYSRIPISDKAPASLNSSMAALSQLSGRFSSNPDLAAMANNPKFAQYLGAFQKGMSWKDLKDFRTMVGDKIGEMRFGENDSTGDFRALYGALSEDMRATAAAQGPKALAAFNRANQFHARKEAVIEDALTRILGPEAKANPEKAAMTVQTLARGGRATGDLKTLSQIRAATIKSGAWDEIAGTLIRLGGQPVNSPGRQFNPETFVNWYADMAEGARARLFQPELRKTLNEFVAVNQRLANTNALRNTSNTAGNAFGGGLVQGVSGGVGVAAVALNPLLAAKMAIGAGVAGAANYGMAKLWTNPGFVKWATGYSRAAASGNANAVKSQIGRLEKLGATNPELREGIQGMIRSLANDNAPIPTGAVASPDEDEQPYGY